MSILGTIKRAIEQWDFARYSSLFLGGAFVFFGWGQVVFARDAGDPPRQLPQEEEGQTQKVSLGGLGENKWDHNLACIVGMAKGSWVLDELGPVVGQQFKSEAYVSKCQYSFHLPLYKGLGYVLGSSFGYYWERRMEDEKTFHRVSSIHFPGIHLGLVYNFSPYFRVEGGMETYLERLDELTIVSTNQVSGESEERRVSLTMRPNFDWVIASDFFYSGNWGLRVEWHLRRVISVPPSASEGQAIGAKLTKKDAWLGVGLIFHLFAT
jgi:hypothetical protein